MKKRVLLAVLSMVAIVAIAVTGTIAWLTDVTTPVTNTFSPSDIKIALNETNRTYKMIPGTTLAKDPYVTVKAGSEETWVFVEVVEANNTLDTGKWINWEASADWSSINDTADREIYAYKTAVDALEKDVGPLYFLKAGTGTDEASGHVSVSSAITAGNMGALTDATYPSLTFYAYAIQAEAGATAQEAWTAVNPATPTNSGN